MNIDTTILAGIISAIISGFVSWRVTLFVIKKNDKSGLENELSEILKIGIEHPYFEQESFTRVWDPAKQSNDERYAAYELYATLVFNHLEKWCSFYNYKFNKVQGIIDMYSWVILHKTYWVNPTSPHENILGYRKWYN